jgi:hypothetical protein
MAERGDLTVLHEPFCNLKDYGETDAGGRTFDSAAYLHTVGNSAKPARYAAHHRPFYERLYAQRMIVAP